MSHIIEQGLFIKVTNFYLSENLTVRFKCKQVELDPVWIKKTERELNLRTKSWYHSSMLEKILKFILTLIFGYIYGVPVMLFRFYKANKAGYLEFRDLVSAQMF